MDKRTIRIKYVNINPNIEDSINKSSMGVGGRDIILEVLEKNYNVEFSDDPEYIFCWHPVGKQKGTDFAKYDCVRIQFILEVEYPDFNCFDYAIGPFHDLPEFNRYCYIPSSIMSGNNYVTTKAYELASKKNINVKSELTQRDFCSFTVSNGYGTDGIRESFFKELSKYKKVDSGGRFLNNIGGPIKDKLEFDRKHKFSIAFDNNKHSFIQEKLDAAFAAQTIPIYWGNTNVGDIYNTKAFINCHDCNNLEEVIARVIELDNDDEKYLEVLREPAFVNYKGPDYYDNNLEKFLKRIIDLPIDKAILRSKYSTTKKMEQIRVYGFNIFYAKKMLVNGIIKVGKTVAYPFRKTKVADKFVKFIRGL